MNLKINKIVFFPQANNKTVCFSVSLWFCCILGCKLPNLVALIGLNLAGDVYPAYMHRGVNVQVNLHICVCILV